MPERTRSSVDAWARENYDRALNLALPDRCWSPVDARWISCVLILPAFKDQLEYSLSVEKRYDGTLLARIVRPKAQSVYTQLCQQKKEHPRASVDDLAKFIETESLTGDHHRFPMLGDLADEFEKIRFAPVLSAEIMMDPTEYRFHTRTSSGETMELTLKGPGSAARHQPQPMIQWAESAREMLAQSFH